MFLNMQKKLTADKEENQKDRQKKDQEKERQEESQKGF